MRELDAKVLKCLLTGLSEGFRPNDSLVVLRRLFEFSFCKFVLGSTDSRAYSANEVLTFFEQPSAPLEYSRDEAYTLLKRASFDNFEDSSVSVELFNLFNDTIGICLSALSSNATFKKLGVESKRTIMVASGIISRFSLREIVELCGKVDIDAKTLLTFIHNSVSLSRNDCYSELGRRISYLVSIARR